jgi:hypothetical protein
LPQLAIIGPPALLLHVIGLDSARCKTVLFGGYASTFSDETWELGATTCYANCDASTTPPVLNVLDFQCFLNRFAAGDSYANCDHSTTPPILNVLDFTCFLNQFAAGCN